jgi:uncharacterized protein (TIGR02594 family)
MTIFEIQKALAAKGFDPGNIDGVWGRRTAAAVRAFQTSKGLLADGVVGPITAKALDGSSKPPKDSLDEVSLVWFQEARRLHGLKEVAGTGDNRIILDWADDLDVHFPHDEIPWCGLFVGHCIGSTLTTEALPTNPLGARNWLRFGAPCGRQPGAVMVFWRGSRDGGLGHVAFYVGEDASSYFVLGGNQSDSVSVARLAKNRLLGARWPATVPMGTAGARKVTSDTALSVNEQ